MSEVIVRPIKPSDRAQWAPLWEGYLTFYKTALPERITDITFGRFFDPLEMMNALVAEDDGKLIGLAHYTLHRSTWAEHCYCYLEDLFVDTNIRGKGAGRALIAGVAEAARAAKATRLYWLTHETNAQARALYDKMAENAGFIHYRIKL
jgi:GNAT superfamily N-acetyltransferase